MYSLIYYIPPNDHERVKQALFAQGAGKTDWYDQCCWAVLGHGQFRAQQGSYPSIGRVGELETITEYKVEMICEEAYLKDVIVTLLKEHPYEQPAYFVNKVLTVDDL